MKTINIDIVDNGEIWIGSERLISSDQSYSRMNDLADLIAHAFAVVGHQAIVSHFAVDDTSDEAGPFEIAHEKGCAGDGAEFDTYDEAVFYLNEDFEVEGNETASCYEVLNRFGNTVYMHRNDWQVE